METVPLVWYDATIAVPPVADKINNTSEEVLILINTDYYVQGFYSHNRKTFYDFTENQTPLYNVTHWAKVILPKPKEVKTIINPNPINN